MICRCNKLLFGVLLGLILPLLTSYLIYKASYEGQYGFYEFLQGLIQLKSLGRLISISVIPNLAVFILVVTYEKLIFAKGLVFATAFWVVVVLAVRFLL